MNQANRGLGAFLVALTFLALAAGTAVAQDSGIRSDQTTTQRATYSQRVDVNEDTVFAALVLGGSTDWEDVVNFDRTLTRDSRFDRNVDLSRDDTLLPVSYTHLTLPTTERV